MSQYYKLNVSKITRETEKAVSITFNVPENLKSEFQFKAGQYLSVKTTLNNEELRRDYSICTSRQSGELKVTVKEVDGGTFSVYANNTLKVQEYSDIVEVNVKLKVAYEQSYTEYLQAMIQLEEITGTNIRK